MEAPHPLDADQLRFWDQNGFLSLSQPLSPRLSSDLVEWTDDISSWPETPGKWMKYYERSSLHVDQKLLCRVEDFIPYHPGFREFLQSRWVLDILSALMNETAILFKEKINFKLSGGNGFKPHQDAPAFQTFHQNYHITLMVALDPSTLENGCLEVVRGRHKEGILPQAADGTLDTDFVEKLKWEPVLMKRGDLLFFDSYIPHRSGPNRSSEPRRALYITYNRESEGSRRAEYFTRKRAEFPPECERKSGVDYSKIPSSFNLGNPIE